MIVARDDGFARSHDDARAVIRYAVPGARVRFWRNVQSTSERGASYEVALDRLGEAPVVVRAAYALPCRADALANHARAEIEKYAPQRA